MASVDYLERLHDAVENYYHFNPDTLMPLLMVALAAQGKLKVTADGKKYPLAAAILNPKEMNGFDWVNFDPALKRQVAKWNKEGIENVCVEMEIGLTLLPIYKIFKQNDEVTVVQEYHHRIGRLVHHSGNEASEKAQRQYATFLLADALLDAPRELINDWYIEIFNLTLVKSGLQPRRPRISVARALTSLLQYYGEGLVYNPFAGCSIAGAMIGSKNDFYGDGDTNEKIYAAGLLLNYGMGISNENFIQRDSRQWLIGKKIDYVVSTYTGFIEGESAFDFCLGKCLEDDSFTGKYAGMVQPKEIIEKKTKNWTEALKRDWISTIVLLPFGEAAVLVDANKAAEEKGCIRLIDSSNPLARRTPIENLIEDDKFAQIIKVNDAKKNGYLKSVVVSEPKEREGYTKVRLGDFVSKIKKSVYDLSKFDEDERVLAYINRTETYYGNRWDENIERKPISYLFGPTYRLTDCSLIVNIAGEAEPRLFDADKGSVFFADAYAFSLDGCIDPVWIAEELKETYVRKQLHPYGINEMVPESLTEEEYLNVVLYKEIEGYHEQKEKEEATNRKKRQRELAEKEALPIDFIVKDGNISYKIIKFISHGAFGFTYQAEMKSNYNGKKELVALKEYFPWGYLRGRCRHENGMVVCEEECEEEFKKCTSMFESEPDFIKKINDVPDNHVTEIKSIFYSKEVNTLFYSMKYYAGESLKDMIAADQVPQSERLIVEKIIVPLCKALNALHSHNILHLDIKPENVVIDDDGEAVLIDFGVAQFYDDNGILISSRDTHSRSDYSSPENTDGGMKYFSSQADIFGVSATLYSLLTKDEHPCPICNELEKECFMEFENYSDSMKLAIAEGLALFVNDRPKNAQLFLRNFPGCEEIKL